MSEEAGLYLCVHPLNRQHTAILRQLTRVGWQAQRMGMEVRDTPPGEAAEAALRALDDLEDAIAGARAKIIEEAGDDNA